MLMLTFPGDIKRTEEEHKFLSEQAEEGKDKSLFQLALEVEDLLEEQRLKRNQKSAGIRTRYIE